MLKTGIRLLGVLILLLLGMVGAAILWAGTPLPLPGNRHATPRWIGPVHVVDVLSGTVHPDQVLRIEEGRIAEILPADVLDPLVRRDLVDVGGAYVVPGLWDMHAIPLRYAPSLDFPLHLAHGVTRLRAILNCRQEEKVELHPCQSDKARWSAAIRRGDLSGPIIMGSGSYPITGSSPRLMPGADLFAAATPEQARATVRRIAAQAHRPDHLKTYDGLPRDSYFALMDEARRLGIEVSGHVPAALRLREAATAGHKAIAHARILPIACSSREADIADLRRNRAPQAEWMALALDHADPDGCRALWADLAVQGTFISPTLITRYNETLTGLDALRRDPDVRPYTPLPVDLIQREDIAAVEGRTPPLEELYRRYYQEAARLTAEAEKAGVRLLVGTDSHDVLVVPGVGLHQEMALWRDAGIPAASILRAATANAAAYFGLEGTHGQVRPGHVADLVFVAGNPLDDIGTLRRPLAVMQEGRLYDRDALDAMLAHARKLAAGGHFTAHFFRDFLRNPLGFAG